MGGGNWPIAACMRSQKLEMISFHSQTKHIPTQNGVLITKSGRHLTILSLMPEKFYNMLDSFLQSAAHSATDMETIKERPGLTLSQNKYKRASIWSS